jgi:hypothetical protein
MAEQDDFEKALESKFPTRTSVLTGQPRKTAVGELSAPAVDRVENRRARREAREE